MSEQRHGGESVNGQSTDSAAINLCTNNHKYSFGYSLKEYKDNCCWGSNPAAMVAGQAVGNNR
ncbi:hypothetical protein IB232_08750 [Pseudomonas sp. PDM15]|uniref:hypothetical protein n=1 Tax=Pseudomonas sp. PDM15 TaxID=2769303 RepID=UPI00178481C6|nr:hypothetical protein [Pseudomonas sp. PDM15]MBD9425403.1 hypothetical protein [Pseudomonas sp. PDM15]